MVLVTPLLSRTPARRKEAGRGLRHPNLITSILTQFATGIWGPKAYMLCVPLAIFSLRPPDSRSCVLSTPCVASLRKEQAQRGHGGCTSLHVEHPSCSSTESVNMVFIEMRLGRSLLSEPRCRRVSVGLVLWAQLPFQKGSQGKYRRAFALFHRESSAHAH